VRNGAFPADRRGGGVHTEAHHQPVLLRPVQQLLHPEDGQGRRERQLIPLVRLLHAEGGRMGDDRAAMPVQNATLQTQARPDSQAVQVHGRQARLTPPGAMTTGCRNDRLDIASC